ncbi:MAG: hypothetical protein ABSC72_06735 [Methylovirgula sp.]|jgi:protein ImuA
MSSLSADIEAEAPLSRRSTIAQLRDSIAKVAAKAGDETFLDRSLKGLGDDPSAAHQRRTRIPLGRDCRLDRLLGGGLALGTLTEIRGARPGDAAAASGFLLGLASRLAARPGKARAAVLWIVEDFSAREQGALYGAGLTFYGLDPARLILVAARGAQQALWAMEEALKCRGPAVVIGELWSAKLYDLTASRRLCLAAQKQGTPALLFLAGAPASSGGFSSGADLRFEVRTHRSQPVAAAGGLPLPGASAWSVRLAKARAGPRAIGIDPEKFHPLIFDPDEAVFRDAYPLDFSADISDRPDQTALARG